MFVLYSHVSQLTFLTWMVKNVYLSLVDIFLGFTSVCCGRFIILSSHSKIYFSFECFYDLK